MATTAQEVLIAELLGDVGNLHDEIKALPEGLKAALAPTLNAIAIASKEGQAISGEIVKQAQMVFDKKTIQLNAEATELKVSMIREHADLQKAARETASQISKAVARLQESTQTENKRTIWTAALASGVASGLFAGLVVFLFI